MRLSMASTMTQVVSSCDEGLVRENRRKVVEGGARADWGWREGGESDSAALPKGLKEKRDEGTKVKGCSGWRQSSPILSLWKRRITKKERPQVTLWGGGYPQSEQTTVHGTSARDEQWVSLKEITMPRHLTESEADYSIAAFYLPCKGTSLKSLGIALGTQ